MGRFPVWEPPRTNILEDVFNTYDGESVNTSQMEVKHSCNERKITFLCVSLRSSRVQLQDSLGSRRACACSEAGFSSQNGDRD
jgi:hypothetical protein